MPGGDGTGPMRMGPMTGRGAGYCAGYNQPGAVHPVLRRGGMGYGRGFGRGAGCGFGPGLGRGFGRFFTGSDQGAGSVFPLKGEESGILKERVRMMQEEIKVLNDRIQEIESRP